MSSLKPDRGRGCESVWNHIGESSPSEFGGAACRRLTSRLLIRQPGDDPAAPTGGRQHIRLAANRYRDSFSHSCTT